MCAETARRAIIVGAGIIGLSIGWKLAQAGISVTVLERGRAGGGTSRAAGGMLAATLETEEKPEPLRELSRQSLALWGSFARALERASGIPVSYRTEGTILVALGEAHADALRTRFEKLCAEGRQVSWLDGKETRNLEPALTSEVAGAIFSPGDHQVDNRAVMRALVQAFRNAGGRLCEQSPVTGLVMEDGVCKGAMVNGVPWSADFTIIAAGAWSAELGAKSIHPVKGQILSLGIVTGAPGLRHVVWVPDAYVVPRHDRIVVGASMEEVGFDDTIDPAVIEGLRSAACRAFPVLAGCPVIEREIGFRPATGDGLPLVGASGSKNLIFATGHHRNGILLAPITAEIVSELVFKGTTMPLAASFAPGRNLRGLAL